MRLRTQTHKHKNTRCSQAQQHNSTTQQHTRRLKATNISACPAHFRIGSGQVNAGDVSIVQVPCHGIPHVGVLAEASGVHWRGGVATQRREVSWVAEPQRAGIVQSFSAACRFALDRTPRSAGARAAGLPHLDPIVVAVRGLAVPGRSPDEASSNADRPGRSKVQQREYGTSTVPIPKQNF